MGRYPTSGYCHTCRKRRVKCDKAKPSCGQCSRSGHFCRGYQPVLRMQHYVAMNQDGAKSPCVATKSLSIPNDGCLTRMAMGRFDEELHSYFQSVYQWAPYWYPTLKAAIDAGSPTVNRLCSLAIIYGCMGKELKAPTMLAKSQAFYAEALHRARDLIEQTDKTALARLVPAVFMMAMYEWSVQDRTGNTHIDGLNQILVYCGPEYFEQETLISTYRSCRILHTCWGVRNRRRSLFEAPIWAAVPWKRHLNTTEDTLLNILIKIPGLMEDMAKQLDYTQFEHIISDYISELHQWRIAWHHEHPTAVWETFIDKSASILSLDETLSNPLEFNSVSLALEMLYCDAALVQLTRLKGYILFPFMQPNAVRPEDMVYICQMAHGANGNGLLLPHQVRFECQLAIEALRVTQYITNRLQSSPIDRYIPPSPFGIVYWALMDEPEVQSCVASKLLKCPPFSNNKAFEEFKVDFQVPRRLSKVNLEN
ncbi:uncharacterized protein TrAtP1_007614 [Trichoderma atroviride]|uniref:uncharacterized protein n=1 Tax=Hypocrea atroviridis TaxID=63577 RepID=UPI00332E8B4C|nr:hypothetical protein TrAtP1_007614 [Trichoderma atroviride]